METSQDNKVTFRACGGSNARATRVATRNNFFNCEGVIVKEYYTHIEITKPTLGYNKSILKPTNYNGRYKIDVVLEDVELGVYEIDEDSTEDMIIIDLNR